MITRSVARKANNTLTTASSSTPALNTVSKSTKILKKKVQNTTLTDADLTIETLESAKTSNTECLVSSSDVPNKTQSDQVRIVKVKLKI